MKILVNVKQLGKKHPLISEKEINLSTTQETLSLKEFIGLVVQQQVEEYNNKAVERDDVDYQKAPQDNYLPFLVESGKIGFSSIYNENTANVDKSVDAAIVAFGDGMYVIFQGEDQLEDLSQPVVLTTEVPFTFIRLTFLAGSYW